MEAISIQAAVPVPPRWGNQRADDPSSLTSIAAMEKLSFVGHEFIFFAKSAIFSVLLLI
jgi:hypothetical protein